MKIDDRKIFDTLSYLKDFGKISDYILDGNNLIICYNLEKDFTVPLLELFKIPDSVLVDFILSQIRSDKLERLLPVL